MSEVNDTHDGVRFELVVGPGSDFHIVCCEVRNLDERREMQQRWRESMKFWC